MERRRKEKKDEDTTRKKQTEEERRREKKKRKKRLKYNEGMQGERNGKAMDPNKDETTNTCAEFEIGVLILPLHPPDTAFGRRRRRRRAQRRGMAGLGELERAILELQSTAVPSAALLQWLAE